MEVTKGRGLPASSSLSSALPKISTQSSTASIFIKNIYSTQLAQHYSYLTETEVSNFSITFIPDSFTGFDPLVAGPSSMTGVVAEYGM